jgi:hypothetical protein
MNIAWSAGWVLAIADASVPTSIAGKMGSTHPGKTLVMTSFLTVKRTWQ